MPGDRSEMKLMEWPAPLSHSSVMAGSPKQPLAAQADAVARVCFREPGGVLCPISAVRCVAVCRCSAHPSSGEQAPRVSRPGERITAYSFGRPIAAVSNLS